MTRNRSYITAGDKYFTKKIVKLNIKLNERLRNPALKKR